MTTLETQSGRLLEPSDKYVAVIGSGVATETYDQEIGINQLAIVIGVVSGRFLHIEPQN